VSDVPKVLKLSFEVSECKPLFTGPEMLTAVLQRTGHGTPGGCGLVDPPEAGDYTRPLFSLT